MKRRRRFAAAPRPDSGGSSGGQPVPAHVAHGTEPLTPGIAYSEPLIPGIEHGVEVIDYPRVVRGQSRCPTTPGPMLPSKMTYQMPPHRMMEINRQLLPERMIEQDTGRRFGVPGIPYPEPGWAGQAGIAQMPYLGAAGCGGRSKHVGDGMVQTYGSLGYASMGSGSMDAAIRGARFAATHNKRSRKRRRRGQ